MGVNEFNTIPHIFSDEEFSERRQFAKFFNNVFELVNSTSHFHKPLDIDMLLKMYKLYTPHNKLDLHQLKHLLLYGGISSDQAEITIQCNVRKDMFKYLNASLQLCLLDFVKPKVGMQLRQYMSDSVPELYVPDSVAAFCKDMLFTKEFKYWRNIPAAYNKVGITRLYQLYLCYCDKFSFMALNKTSLVRYFKDRGFVVTRGYYGKQCGIYVIKNLALPWTAEDINMSILYGYGIITLDDKLCFNDSTVFNPEEQNRVNNYIIGRGYMDEQRAKKERSAQEQAYSYTDWGPGGALREDEYWREDKSRTPSHEGTTRGIISSDADESFPKTQPGTQGDQIQDEDTDEDIDNWNILVCGLEYEEGICEDCSYQCKNEFRAYQGGRARSGNNSSAIKHPMESVSAPRLTGDIIVCDAKGNFATDDAISSDNSDVSSRNRRQELQAEIGRVELKEREREVRNAFRIERKRQNTQDWDRGSVTTFIEELDPEICSEELIVQLLWDLTEGGKQ